MGERTRTPLVLGAGLDRATGVMAAEPRSMREATNVYLLGGKVQARKGMTAREGFYDGEGKLVSHVIAAVALRQHGELLVVGYQRASGKVWVYRCTAAGRVSARFEQPWFELAPGSEPPVVVAAAIDARVFLAHDEPVLLKRAATVYYEPTLLASQPLPELKYPGSSEPMRFRGVVAHLTYLCGWGFDAPGEDRPEFVRVSKPTNPLEWDKDDYWVVGMIGDPVTCCASIDNTLVAFKLTLTYQLFGTESRNFGSKPYPIEATYGCIGSRMAIVYNGACYYWSLSGPRMTDGTGPSVDLSFPLDLLGPAPEQLVAAGSARMAFGIHHANEQALLWIFGRRSYALSLLDDPRHLRWSYGELGKEAFCGAHAFAFASGAGGGSDPGGDDGGDPGIPPPPGDDALVRPLRLEAHRKYRALALVVENRFTTGSDQTNVWAKKEGAGWVELKNDPNTGGQQQTVELADLEADASYTVAVRLRRAGAYAETHSSPNPDEWPAWSRITGKVCGTPQLTGSKWSYTPGSMYLTPAYHALAATYTPSIEGVPVEVLRSRMYEELALPPANGEAQYGQLYRFAVRHKFTDAFGSVTYSPMHPLAPTPDHYCGPPERPALLSATSPSSGALRIELAAASSAATAVWYYGPHPVTNLDGWWPLGGGSFVLEHGVEPYPFIPVGETVKLYGVPHLAGKTVKVLVRSVVTLPASSGEMASSSPYAYGYTDFVGVDVTLDGSGSGGGPGDTPVSIAATATVREGDCLVRDVLGWAAGAGFDGAQHKLEYQTRQRPSGSPSSWYALPAQAAGEQEVNWHNGRTIAKEEPNLPEEVKVHYEVVARVVKRDNLAVLGTSEPVVFEYVVEPCPSSPPPGGGGSDGNDEEEHPGGG